jgi:hypothetical protein
MEGGDGAGETTCFFWCTELTCFFLLQSTSPSITYWLEALKRIVAKTTARCFWGSWVWQQGPHRLNGTLAIVCLARRGNCKSGGKDKTSRCKIHVQGILPCCRKDVHACTRVARRVGQKRRVGLTVTRGRIRESHMRLLRWAIWSVCQTRTIECLAAAAKSHLPFWANCLGGKRLTFRFFLVFIY